MNDPANPNNAPEQTPELRIPFGDQPNQTLPASWAEGMLRELFETDRQRFGRILQSYVTGTRANAPGRKPGNNG